MENNLARLNTEDPGEDLSLLCLTCAGPSGPNSVSLLDYKELRDVLSQHFTVTLDENSHLPLQVCGSCYTNLHDSEDTSQVLSTEEVLRINTNKSLPDLKSSKVVHILLDMKDNKESCTLVGENSNSETECSDSMSSDHNQVKSVMITGHPTSDTPSETLHCVISQAGMFNQDKDNDISELVDLVPLEPTYNDETYNLEEEIFTGCEQTEDEIASFIVSIPSDYEDNLNPDLFDTLDTSKESNNKSNRRKQKFTSKIRNEEPHFEYRKIINQNKSKIDCIDLSDSSNDDVIFVTESQVNNAKKRKRKRKMKNGVQKKKAPAKAKNNNKSNKEI